MLMVTASTLVSTAPRPVEVRNACRGSMGSPEMMESSATPSVTGIVAMKPCVTPWMAMFLLSLVANGATVFSRRCWNVSVTAIGSS